MPQGNGPRVWWTEARTRAAQLVAEGKLNQSAIAQQVGASRMALIRWNQKPEFQERVRQIQGQTEVAMLKEGIRIKSNRLDDLQELRDRLFRVIHERAAAAEHENVPGWKSGLLVHQIKNVGGQPVDHYAHDASLVKELREVEKQAAIEMGEWTEQSKVEMNGTLQVNVGELIAKVYGDVEDGTTNNG